MRIEFYNKATGKTVETSDFFILNGHEVWRDNYEFCESQSATVSFDDFIVECPDIGWRIVND